MHLVTLTHTVRPPQQLTAPRIAGIGIADAERDRPWSDEPCVIAAQRALSLADRSADEVDLLVLADGTVGRPGRQSAALLGRRLGAEQDPAACEVPAVGTAMHLALAMLDADPLAATALVVRGRPTPSDPAGHLAPDAAVGACAWVLCKGPGPLSVVARSGADSPAGTADSVVLDTCGLLIEDVCSSAGVRVQQVARLLCLSGSRPFDQALHSRLGLPAAKPAGVVCGGPSLVSEDGGELIGGELILLLTVESGSADAFLLRV
ncbi:hypothetical protein [Peterkaempfera sp. SMS 1(5)a]|uniref:hypothetical protein n=1 Tax=Peterkaempfera podocarpi TaxID=3232308 RepID=UPI00366CFB13